MAYSIAAYERGETQPYYQHKIAEGNVEEVLRKLKIARSSYNLIKDIKGGALINSKSGAKYKIVVSEYDDTFIHVSEVNKIINHLPKPNHDLAPLSAPTVHGIDKEIEYCFKIIDRFGNVWISKTRSVTQIEPVIEGLKKYGLHIKATHYKRTEACREGWVLEKI